MRNHKQPPTSSALTRSSNAATRVVVSSFGMLLGISSMDHGVLEMMQGYSPTPGYFCESSWSGPFLDTVGPRQRTGIHHRS